MDQLFINERDLPVRSRSPPQGAQAQAPRPGPGADIEGILSTADIEEILSGRRGIAPEQAGQSDPALVAGGDERAYRPPWLVGNDGTSSTERQPRSGEEEPVSWGQFMPDSAAGSKRQSSLVARPGGAELPSESQSGGPQGGPSQGYTSSRGDASVDSVEPLTGLDLYGGGEEDETTRRDEPAIAGVPADPSRISNRPPAPRRYSRPSRPYSGYHGAAGREGSSPGGESTRHPGTLPSQVFRGQSLQTDVIVPRWQPDAEVTFCPICRTQFSFFVRKHHCRKCGRVVCNSCSPHRITIPYQYIVQPPTDPTTTATRPSVDSTRARRSTTVDSLGGGERVRLCNPCVPDPNIAPPQTRSDGQPIQSPGHGRSASTVPYTQSRRGDLDIPGYRQRGRESSRTTEHRHHRHSGWAVGPQSTQHQLVSSSYSQSQRDDLLLRPEGLESRSRSSTVGSSRGSSHSSPGGPRSDHTGTHSRHFNPLSRPLPDTPHQQRTMQHRVIPEEDMCWVCYQELPSRELPGFQDLRDAHVMACLDNAVQRNSSAARPMQPAAPAVSAPPPPAPTAPLYGNFDASSIDPRLLQSYAGPSSSSTAPPPTPSMNNLIIGPPSSSSSSATAYPPVRHDLVPAAPTATPASTSAPTPTVSTPESRMLERERAHAAVVYGLVLATRSGSPSTASSSNPAKSPMSRVIPYLASEKDGIDEAECMICLEGFEVGQEMGRLECFCRFHLHCIRAWWEKRPGKCPVHGVD